MQSLFPCHDVIITIIYGLNNTQCNNSFTFKQLGHFFQNVILISYVVHNEFDIFVWILGSIIDTKFSSGDTDGLVLQHQDISSHSADYAPTLFHMFVGYILYWYIILL